MLDEFDQSLHTKLADFVIDLFHASSKAQFIFTSHNTNLIDAKRFRRDQILFVNKKPDGSSELYSLFDYKDFRENMDAEKGYLQGRFEAIPYVDSSVVNLKKLLVDSGMEWKESEPYILSERWSLFFSCFAKEKTEEAYINYLKQQYRLPIKIIPYITGLSITPQLIKKHIKLAQLDSRDTIATFLMYDLDANGIQEKLAACRESVSISSNPYIELWFLLHHVDQFAEISTAACISKLQMVSDWESYRKGMFSNKQKRILWEKRMDASHSARKLNELSNPSSVVYRLIDAMEDAKTPR